MYIHLDSLDSLPFWFWALNERESSNNQLSRPEQGTRMTHLATFPKTKLAVIVNPRYVAFTYHIY